MTTTTRQSTDWFRKAGFGVFCHYLPQSPDITIDQWNACVDSFDVNRFAQRLAPTRAGYVFLTLGQNSGFYCSPNETYDNLVGRRPSRCAKRDLVADLADALKKFDIHLMVYLPAHAPANDIQAVEGLACTPTWDASEWQLKPNTYTIVDGTDERLTNFQHNWQAVIREWSCRWGTNVHGWWIDGCYFAPRMWNHPDEPNFASFAAAMKAGNPNSIVAFNPGVRIPVHPMTEHEDYCAGEISHALPAPDRDNPVKNWMKGKQYHLLTFLGDWWCGGNPRFTDALAAAYTQYVHRDNGVISWDVPIDMQGTIPDNFLRQLTVIGNALFTPEKETSTMERSEV